MRYSVILDHPGDPWSDRLERSREFISLVTSRKVVSMATWTVKFAELLSEVERYLLICILVAMPVWFLWFIITAIRLKLRRDHMPHPIAPRASDRTSDRTINE
jgi:hypothetical protein